MTQIPPTNQAHPMAAEHVGPASVPERRDGQDVTPLNTVLSPVDEGQGLTPFSLESDGSSSPVGVDLQIDELVLHGFGAADGHRIADALQTELARLLTERKTSQPWGSNGNADDLRQMTLQLQPNSSPDSIGRALGALLYAEGDRL